MTGLRITLSAAALAAAAGPALAQADEPVTLVLSHSSMAVGEEVFLYAVPKAMGWFEAEGLEVEIQGATGGVQAGQVMASGNADFITTLAEGVLQMREQGADPVAVFSLKNYNGYSVAVLPDSPITGLDDLVDATIGFPVAGGGTVMMLDESLKAQGLEAASYDNIVIGWGPGAAAAIEQGQVDAAVLWDAAYGLIENLGYGLRYIDLPIQNEIAGFTLSTSEAMIEENPERVAGFCRAITKGLVFTLANPERAVEIFYEEFPTTRPGNVSDEEAVAQGVNILNKWLESAMKDEGDYDALGQLDLERWHRSQGLYAAAGTLQGTTEVEAAFTNEFIPACNEFDKSAVQAAATSEG